jgi:histidinol-phosphate aminotransferase
MSNGNWGLGDDVPIVKLASNENVLGPSHFAIEAMQRVLDDLWLYPDDSCYELKKTLAAFWKVSSDQLVIGNGSDEIIHLLALAFLDHTRGDEVIFGEPSFVQYRAAAMITDCTYHAVPLTPDMRHDLRAMKAQVNERTKLIFIANPNNPTGTTVTHQEVEELLDGLPSHVLVVLDQAYYEYVIDEKSANGLQLVRDGHNVVVLHTFPKRMRWPVCALVTESRVPNSRAFCSRCAGLSTLILWRKPPPSPASTIASKRFAHAT